MPVSSLIRSRVPSPRPRISPPTHMVPCSSRWGIQSPHFFSSIREDQRSGGSITWPSASMTLAPSIAMASLRSLWRCVGPGLPLGPRSREFTDTHVSHPRPTLRSLRAAVKACLPGRRLGSQLVPQDVLLDLARGGAGQVLDHPELLGPLLASQARPGQVGPHLL